jgi:esterase
LHDYGDPTLLKRFAVRRRKVLQTPPLVSKIVTEMPEDELAELSEFSLLSENAEQAGITGPLPDVARVEAGTGESRISALRWGRTPPRVVFFHGGGQNAHTWDTVIVGVDEPALAVDLPGHGHSAWRADGDYSPQINADALQSMLREHAPTAELVVGMSLGGLTAVRLAAVAPDLVNELVLIDVTPSALQRHSEMTKEQQGTVALIHGDREFPSFQAMLDLTVAAAPHREVKALRRGVFHNSRRLDNGNWTWRYDTIRTVPDFGGLWDDVDALSAPVTLVRGGSSGFVSDEDAAELGRRARHFRTAHVVENSGHSVQSDQPRVLIDILRSALDAQ